MKHWQYAFAVFLGGCSYGLLSSFVKIAYGAGFSMPEVSSSQYIFGVLFIWISTFFIRKKISKISLKQILLIIISGIPMGLTGIFYYKSLQTVDASLAIIFLFQYVWIGTILEWIFFKRKPTLPKAISIIILLIGSFLATGVFLHSGKEFSIVGFGWGMLTALSFAVFILISGTVGNQLHPIFKSALLATGALCTVLILVFPSNLFTSGAFVQLIPYGVFLGLFGVMLPPLLFSIGMPHVGPSLGTILSASELPVAVMMSSFYLKEDVHWVQWVGVIIVLIGIIIGNNHEVLQKKKLLHSKSN